MSKYIDSISYPKLVPPGYTLCAKCGKLIKKTDKTCSRCGKAVIR